MQAHIASSAVTAFTECRRTAEPPAAVAPVWRSEWSSASAGSRDWPTDMADAVQRAVPSLWFAPPRLDGWRGPLDPVLVVDADAGIREFVALALTEDGYPAITATNGSAALAVIQRVRPSVILLDTWMPKMDGYIFLEHYHRLPPPHALVIIFATDARAAARAVQLGASAYLPKPCSLEALFAVIVQAAGSGTTAPWSASPAYPNQGAVLAWAEDSPPPRREATAP